MLRLSGVEDGPCEGGAVGAAENALDFTPLECPKLDRVWQVVEGLGAAGRRDASLPVGIPQLMMGFTEDGQLSAEMLQGRDQRLGISTQQVRGERATLAKAAPPVQPGANGWSSGATQQLTLAKVELKNRRGR